ncbi:MAG: hypothetical protein M1817_001891, partial [Caeruleum heppii]
MDIYPRNYIAPNRPFIVLSGLPCDSSSEAPIGNAYPFLRERPIVISSDLPCLTSDISQRLRQCFVEAASKPLQGDIGGSQVTAREARIELKLVGRHYSLPPHKADPPALSPTLTSEPRSPSSRQPLVLHSPISPLSPGSPTYPNGVFTSLWLEKHQHLVPAVFVAFFPFTSDPNLSSLHDNQLKVEINEIKKAFAGSLYKTRLAVVLVSDGQTLDAEEVEDRLANVRRATGRDSKSPLLFVPPRSSLVELRVFASSTLATLLPISVEYYRDLTKHARRKRNRGAVPPPTVPPTSGTSQILPLQGWNVRYEMKLGILAEFRQELDAASRNYESAYEGLMGQDVFEAIASWSPRWNEARLLADVIAIRILRCLIWTGQTTSAVRKWLDHRERIQDVVDRRGKGSLQYGWKAWEARWAKVMAELIQTSTSAIARPSDEKSSTPPSEMIVYAAMEKALTSVERLPPWEFLHHPGYWLQQSTARLEQRQHLAQEIPEEDRSSPGQSPASQVASKAYTYDTYLCPEPHEEAPLPGRKGTDHPSLILEGLRAAAREFRARRQLRATEMIQLRVARTEMSRGEWAEAMSTLRPLYETMSWRKEGWWDMTELACWTMLECATAVKDVAAMVRAEWELLSCLFTPKNDRSFDLAGCLDHVDGLATKPTVTIIAGSVVTWLSATYTFNAVEGHAGEHVVSQLVIKSHARKGSAPNVLSGIKIVHDGSLQDVVILHSSLSTDQNDQDRSMVGLEKVRFDEPDTSTGGSPRASVYSLDTPRQAKADLTFFPGEVKILQIGSVAREAGTSSAQSVTLSMSEYRFDVDYVVDLRDDQPRAWWFATKRGPRVGRLTGNVGAAIKILPKPPKLMLRIEETKTRTYINEWVGLDVELVNEETESAQASLEVRVLSSLDQPPTVVWKSASTHDESTENKQETSMTDEDLPGHAIGEMAPSARTTKQLGFLAGLVPVTYTVEVKVLYHLVSEPTIPLSRISTANVVVSRPFEANYELAPRIHPDPWPDFFSVDDGAALGEKREDPDLAGGIPQRWCLSARVASFASEVLSIINARISPMSTSAEFACSIRRVAANDSAPLRIDPETTREMDFILDVRRSGLDDRRAAPLDLTMKIEWSRPGAESGTNTMSLAVPRYVVLG